MENNNIKFAFEEHKVYHQSLAFAFACMRKAQTFPVTYNSYAETLRSCSMDVCNEVVSAIVLNNDDNINIDYSKAKTFAYKCIPVIDLATAAGLIRDAERSTLREKLECLINLFDNRNIEASILFEEKSA